MRYKYAIVIRRKNTILYVVGPFTSRKAAQDNLAIQVKQEAFAGDKYYSHKSYGYTERNGTILKHLDVERMLSPDLT